MSIGRLLLYIVLILISTPIVVMVLFLVVASFSERLVYGLVPTRLTLENWSFLWRPIPWGLEREYIWPVLFNTLLYAGGSTFLRVLLVTLAGYAISRISFRGRTFVLAFQMMG
ncbi:MAG: carbohydrate ABC transporter permease, partial [Thermoprotei archaeon]